MQKADLALQWAANPIGDHFLRPIRVTLTVTFALLAMSRANMAQLPLCHEMKVSAPDAGSGDNFGASVDISGDWLIVGAALKNASGTDSGAAYFFQRDQGGWTFRQRVVGSQIAANSWFGSCVAIDGDFAIVGASQAQDAYVFRRESNTWVEEARFQPLIVDYQPHPGFGVSCDIREDIAVVGSPDNFFSFFSGQVFAFRQIAGTWQLEQSLMTDPPAHWFYGTEVATDGQRIAAWQFPRSAVEVFRHDGMQWSHEATINGPPDTRFGSALSFEGTRLFIGAEFDSEAAEQAGAAYVYEWNGAVWNEIQKLTPSTPFTNGHFGNALAFANGALTVAGGLPYIFRLQQGQWIETSRVEPESGAGGGFGYAVAAQDDLLVVGAYGSGALGGSAFIFKIDSCSVTIPALSGWGCIVLTAAILLGGIIMMRSRLNPRRLSKSLMIIFVVSLLVESVAMADDLRPRVPMNTESSLELPDIPSRLVVKFTDAFVARAVDGNIESNSGASNEQISELATQYNATFAPLLRLHELDVLDLLARAEELSGEVQPDILGMMEVQAHEANLEALAKALSDLTIVEWVHFETVEVEEQSCSQDISTTTSSFFGSRISCAQTPTAGNICDYHGSDPGVNVPNPWTSARGNGIKVAVVDGGISTYSPAPPGHHEDLCGVTATINVTGCWGGHGTASLGVIAADDNGYGWTGIAPESAPYFFQIYYETGNCLTANVASALTEACTALGAGDLVVLPLGSSTSPRGLLVPSEVDISVYTATRVCSAAGITVLGSAANSGENLDDIYKPYIYYNWRADSFAAIVGAGTRNPPATGVATHVRCIDAICGVQPNYGFSSVYGKRVNLQGWGD